MNSIEHFVDGKILKANSKKTGKVFDPSTGEQTSEVKLATTADINKAIEVAKKAFLGWSQKTPLFRARVLFKFKELIQKNWRNLKNAMHQFILIKQNFTGCTVYCSLWFFYNDHFLVECISFEQCPIHA